MMKNHKLTFILIFLVGTTLFSFFKYVSFLQEKARLLESLRQTENQVSLLRNEKEQLSQELKKEGLAYQELSRRNDLLRAYLQAGFRKINKLFTNFNNLSLNNSILKAENDALREEKLQAETKLSETLKENELYKARFSSLSELRKAIRGLKIKMRESARFLTYGPGEGNKGYLLKDGKPNLAPEVKIEVIPISRN